MTHSLGGGSAAPAQLTTYAHQPFDTWYTSLTKRRTPHARLQSPLLRLPIELRNMVYSYVFDTVDLVRQSDFRLRAKNCGQGLHESCSQIRNETTHYMESRKAYTTLRLQDWRKAPQVILSYKWRKTTRHLTFVLEGQEERRSVSFLRCDVAHLEQYLTPCGDGCALCD